MISFAPLQLDAIEYLTDRTGIEFGFVDFTDPRFFCATARRDDDTLQGVLVGEFKQWWDCYLTIAVDDASCITPKLLKTIFRTLFSRARRITAKVPPGGTSERSLKRLGFVYEGFLRRGYDGTRDALLFGMLPEDSVWLKHHDHRSPITIGGDHGRPARPA